MRPEQINLIHQLVEKGLMRDAEDLTFTAKYLNISTAEVKRVIHEKNYEELSTKEKRQNAILHSMRSPEEPDTASLEEHLLSFFNKSNHRHNHNHNHNYRKTR